MKTQLLTISAVALLLIGQSASAFEQINSESGYDSAYRNGWVSPETASKLDLVTASNFSQPSTGFEQINSESGYDAAYNNGWISPETASAISFDSMRVSFRSDVVTDMRGQFEDALSINYLTTR